MKSSLSLILVSIILIFVLTEHSAAATTAKIRYEPALYEVELNRLNKGVRLLLLRVDNNVLYIPADTLKEWRLQFPKTTPLRYHGDDYFSLDNFSGLQYKIDNAKLRLVIEAQAELFSSTTLDRHTELVIPPATATGAFANYDLVASGGRTGEKTSHRVDGFLSLNGFNGAWSFSNSHLLRDATREMSLIRLETNLQRDNPATLTTLVLGDTFGKSGIWGRSARFGGISYATNFATRPDLVTYPLPTLRGEATLPSSIELFINEQRRFRANVQPGPFELNNFPVISGAGEIRLLTRDLLGREQVLVQPFYVAPALLKTGLRQDSYEAGWIRKDFGTRNFDYGRAFLATTQRWGVSDFLTLEARAEVLRAQQTIGIGGTALLGNFATVTAAVAGSHSEPGNGKLFFLGLERLARPVSFGIRGLWTTKEFTQLGLPEGQRAPMRQYSGNLGFDLGRYGGLGIGYVRRDVRGEKPQKIAVVNYSFQISKRTTLILTGNRSEFDQNADNFIGVTLVYALNERMTSSTQFNKQADQTRYYTSLRRDLPTGEGFGWRVLAGENPERRIDAGASYQNAYGTYNVDASLVKNNPLYRVQATGSLAILDRQMFFARQLGESFAVVQLPGFANVRIYAENQPVARTNAEGVALLPRLRPYQRNAIRFEPTDLPLDTEFENIKHEAIPYARSGVLINFPIRTVRGALLRLILEDSLPMPAGAYVRNGEENFLVANRGEAFVTGLAAKNQLSVEWKGQTCAITVNLPEHDPLPEIGPLICLGVKR